ncbi:hypothetical protein GW932_03005, partial [archaeon]|nr:hypothetical protein [archaeon]
MNVKRYRLINGILITLIIFSLSLYFLELYSITGHATEGTTYSNVTISKYFSISFSTELQAGIDFGTVATLPATNVNATQNYAGIGSETLYYVNISTDSNTPVDFCLRGISDMQSIAADVLGLGNESYGY